MTIKTRNRLNIVIFFISITVLFFYLSLLAFLTIKGQLNLIPFVTPSKSSFFLFKTNPWYVIGSIITQVLYVTIASYFLFRAFEKTQASDIVYFSLFLFGCLAESLRIIVPCFGISRTYTKLLVACGNAILFGKLLCPLSLLCTIIMREVEQRQDLERNVFIVVLACALFAQLIPLNTSITCSNFEVDYCFRKTISIITFFLLLISIITLVIANVQTGYNQVTSIGLTLICFGITYLFNTENLISLILSSTSLGIGTAMFLKTRHKQYLWDN